MKAMGTSCEDTHWTKFDCGLVDVATWLIVRSNHYRR